MTVDNDGNDADVDLIVEAEPTEPAVETPPELSSNVESTLAVKRRNDRRLQYRL